MGQGWNANGWLSPPDRLALDEVQQEPVYLDSLDVHAAWLNSAALASGWDNPGHARSLRGRIVRDANGDPTGLLFERAVELVCPALPEPRPEHSTRRCGMPRRRRIVWESPASTKSKA